MRVRSATADDVRAYYGRDIPAEWCIGKPVGYVAERDGEIVAMGIVSWDSLGRAWGYFSARECLPAVTMHRKAKEMLALLREVEEPALYAFCNLSIVGSAKWLSRLGFRPDPELSTPEYPVWRCNLLT